MRRTNLSKPNTTVEKQQDTSKEVWHAIRALLIITCILTSFGLTMLYSVSYGTAGLKYFSVQLIAITAGLAGGVAVFALGYKEIVSKSFIWMALAFVLLMITCLFFKPINGAARWIRIGAFSVQPSEFAKIAVAIFVAKYCSENVRTFSLLAHKKGLFPLLGGIALILGGVLCGEDLGTTVLIAATACCTTFAAGLYLRYLLIPGALGGLAATYVFLFDNVRKARIVSFMNPEAVQQGSGYQLLNSLWALGAGNWLGTGFMTSKFKHKSLPESHTDFILAIVGEELGFVAMLAVILLYVLYGYYALKIALRANNRLGMLLGVALTFGITLQAAINLTVVSGSAPTKGMPAPFISYGGSNLIASLLATALIVSIGYDAITPGYAEPLASKLPWNRKKKKLNNSGRK